ncbi:MAG: hypothetical protein ACYTGG_08435 [Planctomycetota bacterium]
MTTPLEVLVYLHGVSNDLRGRAHDEEYKALHDGIARHNNDWPNRYLGVEWGWDHTPGRATSHELLTDAQRQLGARLMPALMDPGDFTLNPARAMVNGLRPLMTYGFGDIFYYVSADGKKAVRRAVAKQIVEFIRREVGDDTDAPISLTLLGHSAGSVVAFDFLFFLFFGKKHTFVQGRDDVVTDAMDLRERAQEGRLRLRRLVTFGSPISMLACRSDPVLKILAAGGRLDPKDYGLSSQMEAGPLLEGPRWINFFDRDDPIAWPVEPLMDEQPGAVRVQDVYVDVSDSVSKAHDKYWRSKQVHQIIAKGW